MEKKSFSIKKISQYRQERIGRAVMEIPVADDESSDIINLNFQRYVNVLAEILTKYAS